MVITRSKLTQSHFTKKENVRFSSHTNSKDRTTYGADRNNLDITPNAQTFHYCNHQSPPKVRLLYSLQTDHNAQ